MKIYFDVKNQIITRTDRNQVIANSADYLETEITFTEEWASLEKTMTFKNGNLVYTYVLSNNKITQDHHLNLGVGTWKVSIIGTANDQKIITNECNLSVNASGWIGSALIPPESIWNQLLVIIQSLHTEAASSAVIRSAVQKYIEDNYDALVKEVIIVGNVKEIIDDLVDDGTISDLLDQVVAGDVPGAVTDWLEDHVDPDTGYVIDDTLTTALAAADAKKVGDELTGLKSALTNGEVNVAWSPAITKGKYYKNADGTIGTSSSNAITSSLWNGFGYRIAVQCSSATYLFKLSLYDATGDPSDGTGYITYIDYSDFAYIPSNAIKFGLTMKRSDGANLSDADVTAFKEALSFWVATDTTLSAGNKPADAKIVGDTFANTQAMIAPAYDSTATYSVGDFVTHDNKSYRCIANIAVAEEWTAAHWEERSVYSVIPKLDGTLRIENESADSRSVGNILLPIQNDFYGYENVTFDLSVLDTISASVNASLEWNKGQYARSYVIPNDNIDEITITAQESRAAFVSCLDDIDYADEDSPNFTDIYTKRITVNSDTSKTIKIPFECKYIVIFARGTTSASFAPDSVTGKRRYIKASGKETISKYGIHADIKSQGQLNLIKRCRQMTDIKWTPVDDMIRISIITRNSYSDSGYSQAGASAVFEDVFKAGVEYTGLPYSQDGTHAERYGYGWFYIGYAVPFSAFASAVQNKESCIFKSSSYNGPANRGAIYGVVCNTLVSYGLGLYRAFSTTELPDLSSMTLIGKVVNEGVRLDASLLEVGDMLCVRGSHVALITDIIKDGDTIIGIEVSESTKHGNSNPTVQGSQYGGLCRRKVWLLDDFYDWFKSFNVHRYANIDTITFTDLPCVCTESNKEFAQYEQMPVIPFMGDGFVYKEDSLYNTTLVVNSDYWNKLVVLKDGERWNADGTTNRYDVSGTSVDVQFDSAGEYEAYLCNVYEVDGNEVETKSKSCYWSVVAS